MRILPLLTIAAALSLTACVGKKQYVSLQNDYSSLQEQYNSLTNQNQELRRENGQTRSELAAANVRVKSLEEQIATERSNNAALREDLTQLQHTLDKSISQGMQGNINISKLVDEINASNKYIQ